MEVKPILVIRVPAVLVSYEHMQNFMLEAIKILNGEYHLFVIPESEIKKLEFEVHSVVNIPEEEWEPFKQKIESWIEKNLTDSATKS
jgi:uncharacterized HAD superfamily protein